jgi:anti-anti-sigma factor
VSDLAELELERLAGLPVARIRGEIDASNADSLRDEIHDFVSNHELGLIVDLSEAGYIDSAGIRALFELATGLGRRRLALHVVARDGSQVAEVLSLVAIDQIAKRHQTLGAAVEALGGDG